MEKGSLHKRILYGRIAPKAILANIFFLGTSLENTGNYLTL